MEPAGTAKYEPVISGNPPEKRGGTPDQTDVKVQEVVNLINKDRTFIDTMQKIGAKIIRFFGGKVTTTREQAKYDDIFKKFFIDKSANLEELKEVKGAHVRKMLQGDDPVLKSLIRALDAGSEKPLSIKDVVRIRLELEKLVKPIQIVRLVSLLNVEASKGIPDLREFFNYPNLKHLIGSIQTFEQKVGGPISFGMMCKLSNMDFNQAKKMLNENSYQDFCIAIFKNNLINESRKQVPETVVINYVDFKEEIQKSIEGLQPELQRKGGLSKKEANRLSLTEKEYAQCWVDRFLKTPLQDQDVGDVQLRLTKLKEILIDFTGSGEMFVDANREFLKTNIQKRINVLKGYEILLKTEKPMQYIKNCLSEEVVFNDENNTNSIKDLITELTYLKEALKGGFPVANRNVLIQKISAKIRHLIFLDLIIKEGSNLSLNSKSLNAQQRNYLSEINALKQQGIDLTETPLMIIPALKYLDAKKIFPTNFSGEKIDFFASLVKHAMLLDVDLSEDFAEVKQNLGAEIKQFKAYELENLWVDKKIAALLKGPFNAVKREEIRSLQNRPEFWNDAIKEKIGNAIINFDVKYFAQKRKEQLDSISLLEGGTLERFIARGRGTTEYLQADDACAIAAINILYRGKEQPSRYNQDFLGVPLLSEDSLLNRYIEIIKDGLNHLSRDRAGYEARLKALKILKSEVVDYSQKNERITIQNRITLDLDAEIDILMVVSDLFKFYPTVISPKEGAETLKAEGEIWNKLLKEKYSNLQDPALKLETLKKLQIALKYAPFSSLIDPTFVANLDKRVSLLQRQELRNNRAAREQLSDKKQIIQGIVQEFEAIAPISSNSVARSGWSPEDFTAAVQQTALVGKSAKMDTFLAGFIRYKIQSGSSKERQFYQNMDVDQLYGRLMSKRPYVFFTDSDKYMTRNLEKREGGFEAIGTDREQIMHLEDYLSYDEMLLSAQLGFVTPTRFINEGGRHNSGIPTFEDGHIEEGYYCGLVGPRMEVRFDSLAKRKEDRMEAALMIIRKGKPSEDPSFMASLAGEAKLPSFVEAEADVTGRYILMKDGSYFDKKMYKGLMKERLNGFLEMANQKGGIDKPAYLHLVGIGLGAWAPPQMDGSGVILAQLQLEAYQELIKQMDCAKISHLDFSYFPIGLSIPEEMEDLNGNKIKCLKTNNDPAQATKEKEGKTLVAMFAWDGNSFPGNEYWLGQLSASGDPAAAACSLITYTYAAFLRA